MRAFATTVCLLLAAGSAVMAQDCDLGSQVTELRGAIDARADALTAPADKAQKKEAAKLAKASAKLGSYVGNDDKTDLKAIGAALKQVVKSGTSDTAIATELGDVLLAGVCVVERDGDLAQELADRLDDEGLRAKVAKKLAKADDALDAARGAVGDDAIAAAKGLLKASGLYASAAKKAQKLLDKQLSRPGPIPEGVRIRNDFLQGALRNETGDDIVILDFVWDVRSFADGEPFDRDRGRASETPTTELTELVAPPYVLGNLNNYAPQFWWTLDIPAPGNGTAVDIQGTVTWVTSLGVFDGEVDFSFIVP